MREDALLLRLALIAKTDKESSHDRACSFSASAIDELNKQPSTQRLPARQFDLLMVGLIALVLLLYVQIIW